MAPKVILISLDGATDTIVDKYLQNGVLDAKTGLGLLKSKGVAATDNETITPSLTAAAHIASEAKDYRVSGGVGNDTFYLGTNGRALGGDGSDKFFVGSGGGNLLSGGAGVDQFWIANGDVPAVANIILDFQIGTDVIGIQGIGAKAADIVLTQIGADTAISFGGQALATLKGIQSNSLTPSNPGQFVFT